MPEAFLRGTFVSCSFVHWRIRVQTMPRMARPAPHRKGRKPASGTWIEPSFSVCQA